MIPRILSATAAVLLACALSATRAPAQETQKKERLIKAGTYPGRIVKMDKEKTYLHLAVPLWRIDRWAERIPGGVRIYTRRVTWTETVEVWLPDEVKVRMPVRPALDAKGRPIPAVLKPNPADRDRHLGGVAGSVEDLDEGQTVQVTVALAPRTGHLMARVVVVLR
jgi:hypothetical protein